MVLENRGYKSWVQYYGFSMNMFSTNMTTKMQANFVLQSNRIYLTRVKNKTKSERYLMVWMW